MKGAAVSAAPAGGKMNHSILKLSVLALAIFVFTLLAWDSLASALPCGSAWKRDPVSGVIGVE